MDGRHLAALSVFAGALALGASGVYRGVASGLAGLAESDQYSYLVVVAAVAGAAVVSAVSSGSGGRLTPSRLLASLSLAAAATLFYALSLLDHEYSMQYAAASLASYLAAVLVLIADSPAVPVAAALLSLAAVIPPPQWMVDAAAIKLSRHVGLIVSRLTGAEYVETAGRVFLVVDTPEGRRTLEVALACSGIVSLSSVAATVPAIGLYLAHATASKARKAAALAASAVAAAAIAFLGNVLRVYSIVKAAEREGLEAGLEAFHSTPTGVYVALAVTAGAGIAYALAGPPAAPLRAPRSADWRLAAAAWVAAAAIAASIAGALSAAGALAYPEGPEPVPVEDLVSAPAAVVLNGTGARVLAERDVGAVAILTGASVVKAIAVDYGGARYYGYVEVADSPVRFHSWRECLIYQGYEVARTWSLRTPNATIYFAEGVKGRYWVLVGYSIYRVPVDLGGSTGEAYVKLSLLATAPLGMEDPFTAEQVFTEVLASVRYSPSAPSDPWAYIAASATYTGAALAAGLAYTGVALAQRAGRRGSG